MLQPIFKSEYINHVAKSDVVNVVRTYLNQQLLSESAKHQEQQALILVAVTKAATYHSLRLSDVQKAIEDVDLSSHFVVRDKIIKLVHKSEAQKIGEQLRVKIQNRLKSNQNELIIN